MFTYFSMIKKFLGGKAGRSVQNRVFHFFYPHKMRSSKITKFRRSNKYYHLYVGLLVNIASYINFIVDKLKTFPYIAYDNS